MASHAAARTATREVRTPTARPYGVARAVAAAPVPLPGAGFVGPHPKIATVERREGSRSPRDRVVALRRRDRKNECACRRSITPHRGDGIAVVATAAGAKALVGWPADAKAKAHAKRRTTRAHQRAAGTNNTALFDIVNAASANGSVVSRGSACSCTGRASVSERTPGT